MIEKIAKKSLTLMMAVFFVKIVGFLKQMVIAWKYGTSSGVDVYFAADGYVSTFIMVIMAAIPPAIVTLYLKLKKVREKDEFISSVLIFLIVVGLMLFLLNVICSPWLAELLGISYDYDQRNDLRKYLVLLSSIILLACISSVSSGLLQSKRIFVPDKLGGLFFSVGIILSVVLLGDKIGVDALLFGFMCGYFCFTIMMVILLLKNSRIIVCNPFKNITFRRFLRIALPIVIGVCVVDVSHLIDRIVASSLDSGSVSSLYYSQVICGDLVNGIIITSVGVVLLPKLTEDSRQKTKEAMSKTLKHILKIVLPVISLITILYIIVGKEFVAVVFERGEFNAESTSVVYSCVFGYSFSLIFVFIREIISRFLYAFEDTRSPMISNIVGVLLNVVLSIVLSRQMGVQGIAYATSISILVSDIVLAMYAKRFLGNKKMISRDIVTETIKVICVCVLTIIIGLIVKECLHLNSVLVLVIDSAAMLVAFVLTSVMFRLDVCKMIITTIKEKWRARC